MKRKQQTKYCDNFKSRYSQFSQVPNKREMVTSNFGKIYHSFQFITTPHPRPSPKKKSWFPMTTPSPIKLCVWFFEVFRGLKIGTLAQNELNGWTRALPISIYYDPPSICDFKLRYRSPFSIASSFFPLLLET